jgi:hypothetical protein
MRRWISTKKWISGGKIMRQAARMLFTLGIPVILLSTLAGCQQCSCESGKKVMLWNGKDLSGWKLYVADENLNVNDIWSVKDGVIHCKGKPNGYMRTKDKYANYRLHLEWRWPDEPTNSGVLLHASGTDQVWPKCIECQLKAGSAGDFVLMGGAGITIDGKNMQNAEKRFVVIAKKEQSSEKPAGQWNTYEIYCDNDTIRCYVNGVLQNEGAAATIMTGWICLQSEGGPIEFRNIYIVPQN